jgi:hypothetical protein
MATTSEVFLAIDSDDLTSEELEQLLGVRGDETWNIGDVRKVGRLERVCKFTRWSAVERTEDPSMIEECADSLLNRLVGLETSIRSLPRGTRKALSICLNQTNTVFGIGLSARILHFASAIGAELDVSVVVAVSDEERR